MAYLAFVFVCLMWGSTFILVQRLSLALGPIEIGASRLVMAGAALAVVWWFKRDVYRLERRNWGPILGSAALAVAPAFVAQPYVLSRGFDHSYFGITVAAVPLLTILASIPMLGLWPTQRQLVGVLGGLACLGFVAEDGLDRGMSLGLLALASVVPVTTAVNNTFVKRRLSHAAALPLTAAILGCAGLMLLPLAFCRPLIDPLGLGGPPHPVFTPATWIELIGLGTVATGLSCWAFFYLVLKRGPLFAGMTTYIIPTMALVWGWLDGNTITVRQLLAMAGVFVMVAVVQSGTPRDEDLSDFVPSPMPEAMIGSASPPSPPNADDSRLAPGAAVAACSRDSADCRSTATST